MKQIFAIVLILWLLAPLPAKRGCQCYIGNRWIAWPCGKVGQTMCQVASRR